MLSADFNIYMDVQQAINLQLVRAFAERDIKFALPTPTLHLNGGLQLEGDGDVGRSRTKKPASDEADARPSPVIVPVEAARAGAR
ncbi:MAG: hypothetical protein ROZ37_08700 [Aromatoleum sp.]|nr:hypothetical protein [Aromatoleum sp.]MDT3670400.1 hypothetical protein [Aromatoleum sp.]